MSFVRTETRRLVALATPVVITQVSMMLMGVVDVIMVGHVGTDALDGASLGRLWVFGTLMFGLGIVMGIDPIVAQAHGSRDSHRMSLALQQGFVIAVLASIPVAVMWIFTEETLLLLQQNPVHAHLAEQFALVQIPSIPVFYVYSVLRQYLQGRGVVRPAMWMALMANVVNVVLNWVFIYGHWGAPTLGVMGSGLATACTRLFMLITLLVFMIQWRLHEGAWHGWTREALKFEGLREVKILAKAESHDHSQPLPDISEPTIVLTKNGQEVSDANSCQVKVKKIKNEAGALQLAIDVTYKGQTSHAVIDNADQMSDAAVASAIESQLRAAGLDLKVTMNGGQIEVTPNDQ